MLFTIKPHNLPKIMQIVIDTIHEDVSKRQETGVEITATWQFEGKEIGKKFFISEKEFNTKG